MTDTAPRRVCDDDDGHSKGGQPDLSSCEEWKRDIEVGWAAISTTGGQVWGAAHRLVDFLEATQHHFQLHKPGICILELGAGTGWLGMTLARNLPYAGRVWMTEQKGGGAMEWLSENLERNRERVRHRRAADAVRAVEDDWAEYDSSLREEKLPEALDHHWHLVVGSDLVYNDVGSRMLPTVLRAHAERGSTVLYCHTKHRLETVDLDFFARLEAVGLCWQELLEPEADDPPDSPPPLTDLFPEMRTAVLRIGLQEQQNTSAHL